MIIYLGIEWFRVTALPLKADIWQELAGGWAERLRRGPIGTFLCPSKNFR